MNKSILLHACWLAIAVAAFVFGRSSVTSPPSDEEASAQNRKSGAFATRSSGPSGPGGSENSRSGSRADRSLSAASGGSGVSVAQFLAESDSLLANKLFADLLLDLSAENAPEIFQQLLENRVDPQRVGLFLEAWGKLDGPAAMEAVANLDGDDRRRGMAALAVITGWAAVDPEAAKEHIAGVENGWQKAMLSQGLVSGLARNDPAAATQFVLEFAAEQEAAREGDDDRGGNRWRGSPYDRQVDVIATEQLRRGTAEATAWAENLPEGDIKAAAFDRVAERLASEDPAAAAEWIKAHAGNEYAQRGLSEVAEEMARQDPAGAVKWIEQLPESSQSGAMAQTMNRWTREDPVAAGEYLSSMPSSPVRDSAVSSFARELDREDPQVAAQWAVTIGDPEVRSDTINSVARSWMRSDPQTAAQWLPNSGLAPEVQQDILRDAQRDFERRERGDDRGRR